MYMCVIVDAYFIYIYIYMYTNFHQVPLVAPQALGTGTIGFVPVI